MIQIAGGILIALAVICLLLVILAIALWYLGELISKPDPTPEEIARIKAAAKAERRRHLQLLTYTALGLGVYVLIISLIVIFNA